MMCAPLGATQVRSGCAPASARARAFSGSGALAREQLGGELARGLALARPGRAVEQVGVRRAAARAAPSTAAACGWASRTLTGHDPRGAERTTHHRRGSRRRREDHAGGRVTRELAARGRELLVLREPGGVELSERIRALVKDPALTVDPRAEALLYAAARAQLVAEQLVPLLDERPVGPARPLRRLLARLPGRGARARHRGDPDAQRVRHRRPDARPHAAAADRPGGRPRAHRRTARPTGSSRRARRSSRRSRAPTTRWPPPSPSASR